MRMLLPLFALAVLAGCATINGVPQTPCQRASRTAAIAHDAIRLANDAGADATVLLRLSQAADVADAVATGFCTAQPTTL